MKTPFIFNPLPDPVALMHLYSPCYLQQRRDARRAGRYAPPIAIRGSSSPSNREQERHPWPTPRSPIFASIPEDRAGEAPSVSLADLAAYGEGLICLAGGPGGPVGRLLGEGQDAAAEAALRRLAEIYPDRLYIELMRHGVAAEDRIEAALIDLAFRHDLPLIATNDCFFPNPEFYEAHDALLCIAEGTVVGQRERRRLNPSYSFKSASEMRALFADVPEACDNTLVIARRCAYMPMPRKPIRSEERR